VRCWIENNKKLSKKKKQIAHQNLFKSYFSIKKVREIKNNGKKNYRTWRDNYYRR